MKTGYTRVRKRNWYLNGGFANTTQFRLHNGRNWEYYYTVRT